MIKTIVRDDALMRAIDRQREWFRQHAVENAARSGTWQAYPERARRAEKLRMAKAGLRSSSA